MGKVGVWAKGWGGGVWGIGVGGGGGNIRRKKRVKT